MIGLTAFKYQDQARQALEAFMAERGSQQKRASRITGMVCITEQIKSSTSLSRLAFSSVYRL